MHRTRTLNFILGSLIGIAAFAGGMVGQAYAHPTSTFITRHTTIRVATTYVLGHKIRICSWRPGDVRVRGLVHYSHHLQTVPQWAGAARKASRTVCAINSGTYRTASPNMFRPSGTVYARGTRITAVSDAPAVGFVDGRVYFGAANARLHGAQNIMDAEAMLVDHGHPLRLHSFAPWTTMAQFSCGARGTDGPLGCDRSIVAQFRGGKVALIEIGHASMPLAARILIRMHVVAAATLDSGGAAMLWTLQGRHNTGRRNQAGHVFGTATGTRWFRHIPMAITINARKAA